MKKRIIAILSCILAISMVGTNFAAPSIQGGNQNSGQTGRSGGGGGSRSGGGGSRSRSSSRGSSSIGTSGGTKTGTKTTGTNTQASTTTTGFFGALDNGHATVPAPGSETTGLPEKVVASINSINEGGSISEATGLKEFAEYKAVGKTLALITTDAQGKISDVPTKVRIYVPNMVEGKDIKVIAYANITGNWAPTEVFGINHQDKTLDTSINGSSTICVVYK